MPLRKPSTVIGTPPILRSSMIRDASAAVASGGSVTGSTITPCSLRFTLSTSSACCSIGMFLWTIPMPPSWANAIAISLSVTVSIGLLTTGRCNGMFRVSRLHTLTCDGRMAL